MFQLAIPNKGSLSESAVDLLREAGYRCRRVSRELVVSDLDNDIDFIFLRPRDIAVYVGNGTLDMGITGRDLAFDSGADVKEVLSLNFGNSNFCYAVPKDSGMEIKDLDGKRIATSYPELVRADLKKRGINATIVRLDGAVEVSVRLGVADAVADVVESGSTLVAAGLCVIGEPIMHSEAVLLARPNQDMKCQRVKTLLGRLKGILVAQTYAMIEYDVKREILDEVCKITPGIESPTVSPLNNPDWVAVKSMILCRESNKIMDKLYDMGARGVIVTDIRSCRI